MSKDTKQDFYLKHRAQIEEWAALREGARQALDGALLAALRARAQTSDPPIQVAVTSVRNVRWRIPGAEGYPAWVELYWAPSKLLVGTADYVWPHLALVLSQDAEYAITRARIRETTRSKAALHGLLQVGRANAPWVWSGPLVPDQEPITVDGYVQDCLARFESAWTDLHPVLLRAVREGLGPSPQDKAQASDPCQTGDRRRWSRQW